MTIIVPKKRPIKVKKKAQTGNILGFILILIALGITGFTVYVSLFFGENTEISSPTAPENTAQGDGKDEIIHPSHAALQGHWIAAVGPSRAEIVFVKDMFQMTVVQDEKGEIRRYSRGFFDYDEKTGKLTLRPDARTGEPDPIRGVIFKMITTKPFDIFISKKLMAKEMTWLPPKEMIESRQIHPVFYYMINQKPLNLVWTKQ